MSSPDEESAVKSRQLDDSSDEDENPVTLAIRKKLSKKSRILDSDEDDADVDKTRDDIEKEEEDKSGSDSDSGSEKSDSRPKKSGGKINRSKLLASSDLESESDTEVRPKKRSNLSDEDGSESEVKPKKKSADDSSDDESVIDSEEGEAEPRRSYSSDEDEPGGSGGPTQKQKTKIKGENRQSRKSKDQALKEIYSESNRMLRESKIGLPYHRPRQRTLDEFLNRKKGTPELIADMKKLPRFGGNIEDVAKVEKLLEDREKMTEEFFKEEEENSDNGEEENLTEAKNDVPLAIGSNEAENVEAADKQTENEESEKVEEAEKDMEEEEMTEQDECPTELEDQSNVEPVETESQEDKPVEVIAADDVTARRSLLLNPDVDEEEDSLRLYLEPDTEKMDDDPEWIPSSQKTPVDTTISEKSCSALSKRLAAMGSRFDVSILSKQPKINREEEIVFVEETEVQTPVGLEHLKDRFVKHVRARKEVAQKSDVISVVRKEVDSEGVVRLKEESFNYDHQADDKSRRSITGVDFEEVRRAQKSEKPGAQQLALKLTLKEQIMEEKRRERQEREERKKLENEEGGEDDDEEGSETAEDDVDAILDDDAEDELGEEEETDEEDTEEGEEEEEEEGCVESQDCRKSRIKCAFLDDEAEDEDGNPEDDDDNDNFENQFKFAKSASSKDQATPVVVGPSGSGRAVSKTPASASSFSTLDFNKDTPFSLITNQVRWTPAEERSFNGEDENDVTGERKGARKKLGFEGLFDQSDPNPENFDDVIGMCSGQFVTQKPISDDEDDVESASQASQMKENVSQTPDTVVLTKDLTQNLSLPEQFKESKQVEKDTQDTVLLTNEEERAPGFMEEYPGFLDSTDDEGEKKAEQTKDRTKVLKKKKPRVVISDDEGDDDESDENGDVASDVEVSDDDAADDDGREVQYDSEENEIEVEPERNFKGFVEKKGRIRGEYLEREAELSGSEVGSEDEDEEGLDRLMVEEGDLDDVDEEAVRDEVGRLHQRQLLDDDQREIRLFQEAFLEDGELHSDNGRTRRFKWKDADDDEDVENRLTLSGGEEDEAEEKDEKWRVERLEREKWMQESESVKGEKVNDVCANNDDSQFFNVASKVMKKLDSKPKSIEAKATTSAAGSSKAFKSPKSKLPLQILQTGNKRGSFLTRDSSTLEKLAEMTKGTGAVKAGSGPKNSKNFIFAVLSPPKEEPAPVEAKEKRKLKSSKNLNEPSSKKPKIDRSIDENSSNTIFGAF